MPGDGIISGKGEATAMKATGEKRDADERIATVRGAQDELLCCCEKTVNRFNVSEASMVLLVLKLVHPKFSLYVPYSNRRAVYVKKMYKSS